MEENENKEQTINKEEIKQETAKTAKEVKETIQNVDIKKDAKETTNFITEMIKNPLERLKEIANDSSYKDFKYAVVLIIIWAAVAGIQSLTSYYSVDAFFRSFVSNALSLIKVIIAPVLSLIIMAVLAFVMNKSSKKSFITILTVVTAAHIPSIAAKVLRLLTIISSNVTTLLNPISSFCSVVSLIFTYFGLKAVFGEEQDSKFVKTFIIIEAIYYVAYLLISYLGIYI